MMTQEKLLNFFMTGPFDSHLPHAPVSKLPGGPEMRTAVRKLVSLKVRLLLESGVILDGRSNDLSTGGIGLLLQQPLALQSVVQVAVQLPMLNGSDQYNGHVRYEVVTSSGKVVFQILRGDNYQVGLQWLNLGSKELSLLKAFVNHHAEPAPRI